MLEQRRRCLGGLAALVVAAALEGAPSRPLAASGLLLRRRAALGLIPVIPVAAAVAAANPPAALAAGLSETAGRGALVLQPFYRVEAKLQAGAYDAKATRAKINRMVSTSPVVVYSYELSPFCAEAIKLLKDTGAKVKVVELGAEWFAVSAENAAIRAELGAMTGQTSLPHVFIGGESIGGMYTGTPGLWELSREGTLQKKLGDAGAFTRINNQVLSAPGMM